MTDLRALRQQLRFARASLPAHQRAHADRAALNRLARHPAYRRARRVAAYFGTHGELDPMPLLERAARGGKRCYLPVLHPFRNGLLWFYRWRPGEPLVNNRFGIPEPLPRARNRLPARQLDLVIVPLLGFDRHAHRLGMGGGFYDRSFAFVRRLQHARRPLLIGVAYELQHVEHLPLQPWDVVLDAVITERSSYTR